MSHLTSTELGNVLWERSTKPGFLIWFVVPMIWFVALICVLFVGAPWLIAKIIGVLAALILLGLSLRLIIYIIKSRDAVVRCHELGVFQRTWRGETSLPYQDVESVTYKTKDVYQSGMYVGVTSELVIEPAAHLGARKIEYGSQSTDGDDELDHLHDLACQAIAERWAADLHHGKSIEWTKRLTLHPNRLEHRPGMFPGKDAVDYPYSEVAGYEYDDGNVVIFMQGQQDWTIKHATSDRNFFAGLMVLAGIIESSNS